MITFQPGDIFLTRWFDEDKNTSPGYWNHSAILNHQGDIVEALIDKGVVKANFDNWVKEVDRYCVVRHFDFEAAKRASIACNNYIGKPYRLLTSTFTIIGKRRINMGLNCVAVVRLAYKDAIRDYKVSFPDDFLNRGDFRKIYGD